MLRGMPVLEIYKHIKTHAKLNIRMCFIFSIIIAITLQIFLKTYC
jgi:hypothetical protein